MELSDGLDKPTTFVAHEPDMFFSMDDYKKYLRSLSDVALREESVLSVQSCHALRMEACRKQWETLGRASVFLECYNKAVKEMK